MSLKARLDRLEDATPDRPGVAMERLSEQIEAHQRYLAGETDTPPPRRECPPGRDPAQWSQRELVCQCVDLWIRGDLPTGEYLPGMGPRLRELADVMWEGCTAAAARDERYGWPYSETADTDGV